MTLEAKLPKDNLNSKETKKDTYVLRIDVPIPYAKPKIDNSRKQCSPGDMLVSNAWRTY